MQNTVLIRLTILTALAPVFWGTTYIVTTEFLPAGTPLFSAVIRVLPAGLMLIMMGRKLPEKREIPRLLILSFLNIGCFQALLFAAAYLLPGGIAAVTGSFQPLFLLFILWMAESKKPDIIMVVISAMSVAGMVMMLAKSGMYLNPKGIAAGFSAAFTMSVGTYFASRWRFGLNKQSFAGWQLFLGGLMLLPVAACFENLPIFTLRNYLGYGYLILFATMFAYYLWFQGLKELSPVAVSVLGLISPLTAVSLGWMFLGQRLSVLQTAGFVIVMVCVAVVQVLMYKRRSNR